MEEFIEDLLFPMKKRIGKGGDKLQDDGKGILRVFSFLSFFFFFFWSMVDLQLCVSFRCT